MLLRKQLDTSSGMEISFRGISRTLPVCWLNSTCQLFNAIDWPVDFTILSRQHEVFQIVKQLQCTSLRAIKAHKVNVVAEKFIKFINGEKNKVPANFMRYDPLWNIQVQQDVVEFINYLMATICDFDKDENDIALSWFKNMFLIQHTHKIYCNEKIYHTTATVGSCMIQLSLPSSEGIITLQKLFDLNFDAEVINMKCEHCDQKHQCKKQKIILRSSKYLLLSIVRFGWNHNDQGQKQRNPIKLKDGIMFATPNSSCRYKVIASINHVNSNYISQGHYITQVKRREKLLEVNDDKANYSGCWNRNDCYVILLERVDDDSTSVQLKEAENDKKATDQQPTEVKKKTKVQTKNEQQTKNQQQGKRRLTEAFQALSLDAQTPRKKRRKTIIKGPAKILPQTSDEKKFTISLVLHLNLIG